MIVAIQLAFVSAAVAVSFVSAQDETTRCSTTLSNYYVETREEIFNQTVGLILSAFSSNDSATNASATTVLYSQLLERLNLTDTANRETAFNQAYDKILASATRTCSRLQGQEVQQSSIDQVQNKLTALLQSEDEMPSAIQSTYGTLLCCQVLTRSDQLGSFVDNLPPEDQAKIFGLSEGLYTLGFVVDDTGSMADEIAKVKQVIRFFVESDTAAPTHYILTSFNDPDVGVPKRYAATNPTEKSQLLSDVNALYAHGGGDCPELGMIGIQNALGLSSRGGQLIVLTDASALDGHLTNSVITQASNLNVIIHFMYSHSSGCGSGYPYYDQVKNATGGFRLDDLNRFQDVAMILQNRSTAYNSISTSVNTTESGGSETDMADCKGIPVSSLSELLSVAINPQGGAARVSLTMPDDTVFFDETISSFTVKDFSSPESGIWTVCVVSGQAEIKQSQEVRFDITAEFLHQDEGTGVYYTDTLPPHTRSEVTVLLFTMQEVKLSLSLSHKLKLVNEAGNAIAEVTLSLCESFLEGRYTLPTVRHRLFYEGFDTSNTTLIVDLGLFDAGPPPVSCVPSCKNGGTCIESNVCSCAQGYLGSDCSTQAICQPGCVHGVCTGVNICTCNFGYTGQSCDSVEFSPCVINTCLNNGTCMRNNLKREVMCSCTPGYTGETCSKLLTDLKLPTEYRVYVSAKPMAGEGNTSEVKQKTTENAIEPIYTASISTLALVVTWMLVCCLSIILCQYVHRKRTDTKWRRRLTLESMGNYWKEDIAEDTVTVFEEYGSTLGVAGVMNTPLASTKPPPPSEQSSSSYVGIGNISETSCQPQRSPPSISTCTAGNDIIIPDNCTIPLSSCITRPDGYTVQKDGGIISVGHIAARVNDHVEISSMGPTQQSTTGHGTHPEYIPAPEPVEQLTRHDNRSEYVPAPEPVEQPTKRDTHPEYIPAPEPVEQLTRHDNHSEYIPAPEPVVQLTRHDNHSEYIPAPEPVVQSTKRDTHPEYVPAPEPTVGSSLLDNSFGNQFTLYGYIPDPSAN